MELMTLIHAFSITLSFMLLMVSCTSDQLILEKAAQQYVVSVNSAVEQSQTTLSLLPRKLKLEKDVKSSADKDIMLHKKLLESSSGKKENVVRETSAAMKGTWREWVERGPSKSEYFTMDYSRVRRRRPIHNTFLP